MGICHLNFNKKKIHHPIKIFGLSLINIHRHSLHVEWCVWGTTNVTHFRVSSTIEKKIYWAFLKKSERPTTKRKKVLILILILTVRKYSRAPWTSKTCSSSSTNRRRSRFFSKIFIFFVCYFRQKLFPSKRNTSTGTGRRIFCLGGICFEPVDNITKFFLKQYTLHGQCF